MKVRPYLFRAVEIDGVPYWDGGYLGNPHFDGIGVRGTVDLAQEVQAEWA